MMIMVRRLVLMSIDDNTDDNKTHFFSLMPMYRARPPHIGRWMAVVIMIMRRRKILIVIIMIVTMVQQLIAMGRSF